MCCRCSSKWGCARCSAVRDRAPFARPGAEARTPLEHFFASLTAHASTRKPRTAVSQIRRPIVANRLRRAGASGVNLSALAGTLLLFSQSVAIENAHPLQGGIFRLKFRRDRRPTFAIEPVLKFYPRRLWDSARKLVRTLRVAHSLHGLARAIKADPQKKACQIALNRVPPFALKASPL